MGAVSEPGAGCAYRASEHGQQSDSFAPHHHAEDERHRGDQEGGGGGAGGADPAGRHREKHVGEPGAQRAEGQERLPGETSTSQSAAPGGSSDDAIIV